MANIDLEKINLRLSDVKFMADQVNRHKQLDSSDLTYVNFAITEVLESLETLRIMLERVETRRTIQEARETERRGKKFLRNTNVRVQLLDEQSNRGTVSRKWEVHGGV